MSKIKLIVTRPMHVHGQRKETGDILSIEDVAVCAMLESGRCELLDPADMAAVTAAGRRQVQDLMNLQRRMSAPPGSPWHPLN